MSPSRSSLPRSPATPNASAVFQQEAQAVAALSHPTSSPCTIRRARRFAYLVTECLEGDTLRDRMRPGALPLRRPYESANKSPAASRSHEKGIIHRV